MSDKKDIDNPLFWKERLAKAKRLSHSIYYCNDATWMESEERQRSILKESISPNASILDAGCAYGRLLDLLPPEWQGDYLGIDLSEDFIERAKQLHPDYSFMVCRINGCEKEIQRRYDVAVLISIKQMVIANLGEDAWNEMEDSLSKVVDRLIIIEY